MESLVQKTIEKTEIKKLSDRELVDKYYAICRDMEIQLKTSRLGLSSYEQSKSRLIKEIRKRGLYHKILEGE